MKGIIYNIFKRIQRSLDLAGDGKFTSYMRPCAKSKLHRSVFLGGGSSADRTHLNDL